MKFIKLSIALLITSISITSLAAMSYGYNYYVPYATPRVLSQAQEIVENPGSGPFNNLNYAKTIVSNQKKAIQNAPLIGSDEVMFWKYLGYGLAVGPIIHGLVRFTQLVQRQKNLCDINYNFKEEQRIQSLKDSFVNKLMRQKQYPTNSPTLLVQNYITSPKHLDETYKTKRIHAALDRLSCANAENQIIQLGYRVTDRLARELLRYAAPISIAGAIKMKLTHRTHLQQLNNMEQIITEKQSCN